MQKKENIIQMQIVSLLSMYARKNNFVFFSVPNESALLGAAGDRHKMYALINHLKKMGMTPGVADMVITKEGLTYYLELKSENGRLSPDQEQFKENALNSGAKYEHTNNYDLAVEILKSWGII
jgi:hypothetical protein